MDAWRQVAVSIDRVVDTYVPLPAPLPRGSLLLSAVVAIYIISTILVPFLFPRKGTVKEWFPLHNTVRLLHRYEDILDFVLEVVRSSGKETDQKTFFMKALGLPQFVFVNSVQNVEYVLKTNFKNYQKGPEMKRRFQGLLGDGIFNVDNELWHHHRKTSSYLFNMTKFRGIVLDTFNDHSDKVIDLLFASQQKPLDFQALMFKYTLDSIGKIAFGHDIGALRSPKGVQFADDFDYCQEQANQSFLDPFWLFKRYFTPAGWKYFAALRRVDNYAYGMVKKRREEEAQKEGSSSSNSSSNSSRNGQDLIGLYLSRQNEEKEKESESEQQGEGESSASGGASLSRGMLTDTNLRDIILNFIIAGRDTTAQALSWTFFRLCEHLPVQERAREEVMSILAARNSSSSTTSSGEKDWVSYDELHKMKYLDAVCREVLRLHPSVPKESKYVVTDDTLPDGTRVRAGDMLIFCPWVMGRTESIWTDAMTFNPDRFMTGKMPSSFQFISFQAGPRICLGQDLALLEMKCCLARLLSKFTFTLAQSPESVTYLNTITLPIKNGLQLIAKPIEK